MEARDNSEFLQTERIRQNHVDAIVSIHKILDGVEWEAETIELVAEVISSLEGYEIRGPDEIGFNAHIGHFIAGKIVQDIDVKFTVEDEELQLNVEDEELQLNLDTKEVNLTRIIEAYCDDCDEWLIN